MGVGRLGVVHVSDTGEIANLGYPMWCRLEVMKASPNRARMHPVGPRKRRCSQRIGDVMRSLGPNIVDARQLEGCISALLEVASIDQHVVHDSEHSDVRNSECETDGPTTLDDVRAFDHSPRDVIVDRIDRGVACVSVNTFLSVHVLLDRTEVVEVIIGDVQAYGRPRAHRCHERKLRRAHFHGNDLDIVVHDHVDERNTDISC